MSSKHLACTAIVLLTLAADVPAQTQETLEQLAPPAATLSENIEDLRIENSRDIGVLRPVRRTAPPDALTLYTSQTLFHSDNVLLTRDNELSSSAWLGTFGAQLVPYSTWRWTPRIEVEQFFARYDKASLLDFSGQTISLESRYHFREDRTLFWDSQVAYRRIESDRLSVGEFYRHAEAVNSITWVRRLSEREQLYLVVAPELGWRQASPGFENRLEAAAVFSVVCFLARELRVQPYIRPAFHWYPTEGTVFPEREDFNVRTGVNLAWQPNRFITVSGGVGWVWNESSFAPKDYSVLLPIGSLAASIGF